ncbi:hypothetical protein LIA77_09879 [Sarocladium implicatum]|nr:hypothetical protein LIA77_09879 [Sarocladium implicatum]
MPTSPEELVQVFMNSLHAYHSEAVRNASPAQLSNSDHRHMATSIIGYIKRCERQTRTAARAEAGLSLPDGSVPRTRIELPPRELRLDDRAREKLMSMRMKDFKRFLGELGKVIWKALGIKTPRKRKALVIEGEGESSKRVRMENGSILGNEASRESGVNKLKPAVEAGLNWVQQANNVEKDDIEREQQSSDPGGERGGMERVAGKHAATEPTTHSVTSLPGCCTAPSSLAASRTFVHQTDAALQRTCDLFEHFGQQSAGSEPNRTSEEKPDVLICSTPGQGDALDLDQAAGQPDGTQTASQGMQLDLEARAAMTPGVVYSRLGNTLGKCKAGPTPQNLGGNQEVGSEASLEPRRPIRLRLTHFGRPPKPLVQSLLLEHVTRQTLKFIADDLRDDPEQAEEGVKVPEPTPLPAPLPFEALYPKLAKIPTGTWAVYQRDLERLYYAGKLQSNSVHRRISKIADICLVPEENRAMMEGDWERTMAAVVIVGFLAETMRQDDDDGEKVAKLVDSWTVAKMQELRFMKRMAESEN